MKECGLFLVFTYLAITRDDRIVCCPKQHTPRSGRRHKLSVSGKLSLDCVAYVVFCMEVAVGVGRSLGLIDEEAQMSGSGVTAKRAFDRNGLDPILVCVWDKPGILLLHLYSDNNQ